MLSIETAGIHPYTGNPMTFKPSEIIVPIKYLFPDTLGNSEAEEVAARLIWVSKEVGSWVGVSWAYLGNQLGEPRESGGYSCVELFGPQAIVNGIHWLLDRNYLTITNHIGQDASVMLPTIKLVNTIAKKWLQA